MSERVDVRESGCEREGVSERVDVRESGCEREGGCVLDDCDHVYHYFRGSRPTLASSWRLWRR